jgi:hydroxyacylglutathione hydrolase
LIKLKPGLEVYGGDERIKGLTRMLKDQDTISLGSLKIRALSTPCHTSGSISYHAQTADGDQHVLFTGDTLFVGGCGRFFEGTAKQMEHNMMNVYAALPKQTLVYPGHEYTLSNLRFAHHIDPNNQAVRSKLEFAQDNQCTVPSVLGEEFQYNPFMRIRDKQFQSNFGISNSVDLMHHLRELKNNFNI